MLQKCPKLHTCGYRVCFSQALNRPKYVFGRGSAPDPAGGACNAPPDPLVGWGGGPPYPSTSTPNLDAFGVSISAPAPRLSAPRQHKFLATPICVCHIFSIKHLNKIPMFYCGLFFTLSSTCGVQISLITDNDIAYWPRNKIIRRQSRRTAQASVRPPKHL